MDLAGLRVRVLGANGFIGAHTCAAALAAGAEVSGADLSQTDQTAVRLRQSLGADVPVATMPHMTVDAIADHFDEAPADVVVHAVGTLDRGHDSEAWRNAVESNVSTMAALIGGLARLPAAARPVVVVPGSQMEYGAAAMTWAEQTCCEPIGAYAASKAAATALLLGAFRSGTLEGTVVRLPIVFGEGQRPVMLVPEVIVRLLGGQNVPMTTGQQRRRPLYVGDAANILLRCAVMKDRPALVNAPAYPPLTIAALASAFAEAVGGPGRLRYGTLTERPHERPDLWCDSRSGEALGLGELIPFEDAVERTVAWYRENIWFSEQALDGLPVTGV